MVGTVVEDGFRGPQVCKIVGITYRQLDYWARTHLVEPSVSPAKGSGTQRLYSFTDIVHLRVIKSLIDAGVSLQQTRRAVDYLRQDLKQPLEEVTILSDGHSIYACRSKDEVIDLLARGQGVFGIAVGKVYEELQGSVADITSRRETSQETDTRKVRGG
jgi:DNA-binding transcriptional MerR regulator